MEMYSDITLSRWAIIHYISGLLKRPHWIEHLGDHISICRGPYESYIREGVNKFPFWSLKDEFKYAIHTMVYEMNNFLSNFWTDDKCVSACLNHMKWSYVGSIDKAGTVEKMYEYEIFGMRPSTFEILCECCVEDSIRDFWNQVSNNSEYEKIMNEIVSSHHLNFTLKKLNDSANGYFDFEEPYYGEGELHHFMFLVRVHGQHGFGELIAERLGKCAVLNEWLLWLSSDILLRAVKGDFSFKTSVPWSSAITSLLRLVQREVEWIGHDSRAIEGFYDAWNNANDYDFKPEIIAEGMVDIAVHWRLDDLIRPVCSDKSLSDKEKLLKMLLDRRQRGEYGTMEYIFEILAVEIEHREVPIRPGGYWN
uniref:Uncharacterized protein n=1 Tax=Bracon brevicornis TaxID=1563983 RepID=A0A6V7JVY2_9HYME